MWGNFIQIGGNCDENRVKQTKAVAMLLEMFFFFLLFFSFLHILKKRTVSLCLFAIRDVQKVANLLDLAKSFPKSIWLRTSVSKKPRTIFRETVDAVLPESLRDDVVVHEGNAGLVHLAVSALVDELLHGLQVRVPGLQKRMRVELELRTYLNLRS